MIAECHYLALLCTLAFWGSGFIPCLASNFVQQMSKALAQPAPCAQFTSDAVKQGYWLLWLCLQVVEKYSSYMSHVRISTLAVSSWHCRAMLCMLARVIVLFGFLSAVRATCSSRKSCCPGKNISCSSFDWLAGTRGVLEWKRCFCDEFCLTSGDCCSDYKKVCAEKSEFSVVSTSLF